MFKSKHIITYPENQPKLFSSIGGDISHYLLVVSSSKSSKYPSKIYNQYDS